MTFEQTSFFELGPAPPAIARPPALPPELPGELRDAHQMAWSFVGRGAAGLLRSTFDRKRLTTALAIYGALADLSNEARAQEFPAKRERVASHAGVSERTIDAYIRTFEKIGLLAVVRARGGGAHRPNVWRLLQVEGDARGAANRTPEHVRGETNDAPDVARGAANRTPLTKKKEQQEGNVIPLRDRQSRAAPGRDFSRFDEVMRR